MMTILGADCDDRLVLEYLDGLIGRFYKILPIWESGDIATLPKYMESLQREMIGHKNFIVSIQRDAGYMALLSTLQFLIDHPDAQTKDVKADVFKCIRTIKLIKARCERKPEGA